MNRLSNNSFAEETCMDSNKKRKVATLDEHEIVSKKKISRRSLLESTGLGVALGVMGVVGASMNKAHASDSKQFEGDKKPPRIDPDKD
jgi:hypothetical protein